MLSRMAGRAWTAAELRRKSFKDLHTLWYVLLRERNLLATQREEGRRLGVQHNRLDSATKVFRVRTCLFSHVLKALTYIYLLVPNTGPEINGSHQVCSE